MQWLIWRRPRRSVFVAALLAMTTAARARAETKVESVAFAWNAPAECPTGEQVLAEVARVIRGRQERVAVRVHVDVERTPSARWQGLVSLDTADAHGERRFEAESCTAIASASALIIALTVEGGALLPPEEPPPAPAAPAPPPVAIAARPQPIEKPAPPRPSQRPSQFIIAAAGAIDAGVMPGGAAGGGELALGFSLYTASWRVRTLGGAAYFPVGSNTLAATGEGGRFSLFTLSLRACLSGIRGRLDLGPCVGGEIESMSAAGFGPPDRFEAASGSSWWAAGVAGALASWRVSPLLAVVVRGEAVFTPTPQRFVVQPGSVLVHSPAQIAGRATAGIELRF
jgi:hypothetical protein